MTTARQHEGNGGTTPNSQHDVYYWPSPDEEPVVGELTAHEAIQLAVKATQARFRRKGVSEEAVLSKQPLHSSKPEARAEAKAAHNLLLALLNNSSVEYPDVAGELKGYGSEIQVEWAAMQATRRVEYDPSLQAVFENIQKSYLKQFIGKQAIEH